MQEVFNVREIIRGSVAGREGITEAQIDAWTSEVEAEFGLEPGQTETIDAELAAEAAGGNAVALERFDRWRCIRCVAYNIGAAAAIGAAIAVFGPASPGVVPWIAAKFGISEAVAAAAVGGAKGAALSKLLCKNVC